MLQFTNSTSFEGTILPTPDPDGIDSLYTIVKGTFELNGDVKVAEEQIPVTMEDTYRDDPTASSIEVPSDLCLVKPGTDVLLLGHAYAAAGRPTPHSIVSVSVGAVDKTICVFGDRAWESGMLGLKISDAELFESMPLMWERAFGGTVETEADPPELFAETRNPIGVGFSHKSIGKPQPGDPLPNFEDPDALITSPSDKPTPAGLGPICPHWDPRRGFAGTYDETWEKKRMPYLPEDFDSRFFQVAPPDQIVEGYLTGGETVRIAGATPDNPLEFQIPTYDVSVTYAVGGSKETMKANLDTVLIEPDAHRLTLVWRSVLQCDKKTLEVTEIEATATGEPGNG